MYKNPSHVTIQSSFCICYIKLTQTTSNCSTFINEHQIWTMLASFLLLVGIVPLVGEWLILKSVLKTAGSLTAALPLISRFDGTVFRCYARCVDTTVGYSCISQAARTVAHSAPRWRRHDSWPAVHCQQTPVISQHWTDTGIWSFMPLLLSGRYCVISSHVSIDS